jgi:hypothetical protein
MKLEGDVWAKEDSEDNTSPSVRGGTGSDRVPGALDTNQMGE